MIPCKALERKLPPTDEQRGGREMVAEQLELDFGTPDPLPSVTYFDPILGPIQGPADLYGA